MASILMRHPETGGEYPATPGQVEHLKRAGWQIAEGQDTSEIEEWPAGLRRFGGQPQVDLYHPKTGGSYTSPESAVSFHREKGWLVVGSDDHQAATGQQYEGKTVEELREIARAKDLKVSGNKDELLARLRGTEQPDQDIQEQAGDQPAEPSEEES